VWGQGPLPRAPSASPRGPLALDDSPLEGGGARTTTPQVGGRWECQPGHPPPCWPTGHGKRARAGHAATPLAPAAVSSVRQWRVPACPGGGAPTIRGSHHWRGPGQQHPGPTLGSPAASCPGPPATLGRARPSGSGPPGWRPLQKGELRRSVTWPPTLREPDSSEI